MRRFILIFFIAFLPLQFAWASAAQYCMHETSAKAQTSESHFGHHQSTHKAVDDTSDKDGKASLSMNDADCDYCHSGCSQPLASRTVSVPVLPKASHTLLHAVSVRGPLPNPIERPNWSLTA